MLTFTVHEPPSPPADRLERAESLVFVKDGFSWAAALFGPVWLLVHRLWLPLLGYIVVCAALEGVRWGAGLNTGWVTLGTIGLALLIGMEAGTLRRWRLDRKGWRMIGSVSGRKADECERRFFEEWLPKQPVVPPPLPSFTSGGSSPRRTPIIGSLMGARS
jgi:Protein of unknown function (DUF2628)